MPPPALYEQRHHECGEHRNGRHARAELPRIVAPDRRRQKADFAVAGNRALGNVPTTEGAIVEQAARRRRCLERNPLGRSRAQHAHGEFRRRGGFVFDRGHGATDDALAEHRREHRIDRRIGSAREPAGNFARRVHRATRVARHARIEHGGGRRQPGKEDGQFVRRPVVDVLDGDTLRHMLIVGPEARVPCEVEWRVAADDQETIPLRLQSRDQRERAVEIEIVLNAGDVRRPGLIGDGTCRAPARTRSARRAKCCPGISSRIPAPASRSQLSGQPPARNVSSSATGPARFPDPEIGQDPALRRETRPCAVRLLPRSTRAVSGRTSARTDSEDRCRSGSRCATGARAVARRRRPRERPSKARRAPARTGRGWEACDV